MPTGIQGRLGRVTLFEPRPRGLAFTHSPENMTLVPILEGQTKVSGIASCFVFQLSVLGRDRASPYKKTSNRRSARNGADRERAKAPAEPDHCRGHSLTRPF